MQCFVCYTPVMETDLLKCISCMKTYHYACFNMTSSYYLGHLFDLRKEWKCTACCNVTQRKKSNKDMPIDLEMECDLNNQSAASSGAGGAAARKAQSADASKQNIASHVGPITIEQIAQLLDSKLDEKINPKLTAFHSSLTKQFQQDLDKYFEQVKVDFTKSLEFLSGQLSDMKSNVTQIEAKVSKLESENIVLRNELTVLKTQASIKSDASELKSTILQLNSELNERDQASLINDVEIAGIPEFPGESVTSLVTGIANKLGMQLDARDIVYAAREGAPRSAAGAAAASGPAAVSGPAAATRMLPRRIVVRLARQALRDDLLHAARVRRDVTTADIGLPHHVPVRVYINERLTKMNRVLLGKAREAKRKFGWRFVWTREGRIYARKDDSPASRTQRLRNDDDLARVFGNESVGQKS